MCTPSKLLNNKRIQPVLLPGLSRMHKDIVAIVAEGCKLYIRTVLAHIDSKFLELTCPIYTLVAHFASGKWLGTDSTVFCQHLLVIISHPEGIIPFLFYYNNAIFVCVFRVTVCREKGGAGFSFFRCVIHLSVITLRVYLYSGKLPEDCY